MSRKVYMAPGTARYGTKHIQCKSLKSMNLLHEKVIYGTNVSQERFYTILKKRALHTSVFNKRFIGSPEINWFTGKI